LEFMHATPAKGVMAGSEVSESSAYKKKPYTRAVGMVIYSGDACKGEAGFSLAAWRKMEMIEIINSGDECGDSGHCGNDSGHSGDCGHDSGHSGDDESDRSGEYTCPCSECPGHSGDDSRDHKAEVLISCLFLCFVKQCPGACASNLRIPNIVKDHN
jgi:hypothetical protein